jgi:hypothetical protein
VTFLTAGGRIDTRALTERVERAAVTAHARRHPPTTAARVWAGIGIAVAAVVILGLVIAGGRLVAEEGDPVLLLIGVVVLGVLVGVVLLGGWAVRVRRYRLSRFAEAHGMTYHPSIGSPDHQGMIFGVGDGRRATDVLHTARPRPLEIGNYSYTTGSGKTKQTHRWGYVAIGLDTELPHIVLDATRNDFLGSNLPAQFVRTQRLSLEGDFDRHFSLYAPAGYERDALYLFTPDVMARFIDLAAALDVEIIDDRLFLYAHGDLVTLDPARWERLAGTVAAITEKLDQWERWRDDRLAPAPAAARAGTAPSRAFARPRGVAAEGRRLRRRVSWTWLVAIALAAASIVWQLVTR